MNDSDQGVIEGFEGARLTPLQLAFAQVRGTHPKNKTYTDAYCLELAGSGAAKSSLDAIASKYMKIQLVKSMIERERASQGKRVQLHGDQLVADAMTVIDISMGRLPVQVQVKGDDGLPTDQFVDSYGFDARNAKAGIELLMRHKGMLTDKKEVTGADGAPLMTEPRKIVMVAADKDGS